MNRRYTYLLFFVITLLSSCKKSTNSIDSILPQIDYKPESSIKKDLSKLLEKYRLIRLETNDSCLIGRNSKILRRNKLCLVLSGYILLAKIHTLFIIVF